MIAPNSLSFNLQQHQGATRGSVQEKELGPGRTLKIVAEDGEGKCSPEWKGVGLGPTY